MYFDTKNKQECFGCESCQQACPHKAISMKEDIEGFRYPEIDESLCTHCNLCRKVCPYYEMPHKYQENKYIFGGYALDSKIRFNSTSGGAFSVIVETFCKDKNYAIFGAVSNGLDVTHRYITEKKYLKYFRKSKYSQSNINDSYKKAKEFLSMDYQVVFSGTPCQIAGLYAYLKINACNNIKKLLTIEVICEGVPSPLYFRKMDCSLKKKYYSDIKKIDYRYKGRTTFEKIRKLILKKDEKISKHGIGKWDFEIMKITLENNRKIEIDRWFNPFWSIWLQHLMSRPCCYQCPFTEVGRVADITLGDLWGVHIYCPELYGNNGGSSLIIGNTDKGRSVIKSIEPYMYGHELKWEDVIKYQGPLHKHIAYNNKRNEFMEELLSDCTFDELNEKWAQRPSLILMFQKYIWGNRQKVWLWNLINHINREL